MAGSPKKRAAREASARSGDTYPEPSRSSPVAQAIASTLPLSPAPASSAIFPPRTAFPGVGPSVVKRLRVTAFDPPAVSAPPPSVQAPERLSVPEPEPPELELDPEPPAPDLGAPPPPRAPAPAPPARPFPTPFAPPPAAAAAQSNTYAERMRAREHERWAKSKNVPAAEVLLVHAWAHAVTQYPAHALTLWLTRTSPPQNPYEFFIAGEELAGDPFPDRKCYEVARSKRRQPTIAEGFSGRIRGMTHEGQVYDCGYGEIHFPPDERAAPAPVWGQGAPPPGWGPGHSPGYGAPPGYGPPGYYPPSPYYPPPPGYGAPAGYGGAPPPWAHAYGGWPAPPPAPAPPAHIAADPSLLEIWKLAQEANTSAARISQDAQSRAAEAQTQLMQTLLQRVLAPPAAPAAAGGMKETFGMLGDAISLLDKLRGPPAEGGRGGGLHIHKIGEDLIVENKDGEIDAVATLGLGMKDGVREVIKAVASRRAAKAGGPSAPGAPGAGTGLSGASVKKQAPPAALPSPGTEGSANGAA